MWVEAILSLAWVALADTTAPPKFDFQGSPSKEAAREVIRTRKFSGRRDLVAYLRDFPVEFADELFRLTASHRLLDAGGGAFYFAEEMVSLRKMPADASSLPEKTRKGLSKFLETPLSQRPQVTSISLNLERKNIPTYEGRLKLFWGRFFAEIPETELGKFDLITDLKGIFAYSPDADEVLRRYLSMLTPTGSLFLYLGEEKSGFAYQSTVRVKSGDKENLKGWIQKLPGVKAELLQAGGSPPTQTLRIRVAEAAKPEIPVLSLLGIDSQREGPPVRVYYER